MTRKGQGLRGGRGQGLRGGGGALRHRRGDGKRRVWRVLVFIHVCRAQITEGAGQSGAGDKTLQSVGVKPGFMSNLNQD